MVDLMISDQLLPTRRGRKLVYTYRVTEKLYHIIFLGHIIDTDKETDATDTSSPSARWAAN